MKIKEILESATAGATSSASIATVPNPHLSPGKARGKKSYTGSPWTGSGTKSPPQPKPKKQKPTDNALDMKTSLFGEGNLVRRQDVAEADLVVRGFGGPAPKVGDWIKGKIDTPYEGRLGQIEKIDPGRNVMRMGPEAEVWWKSAARSEWVPVKWLAKIGGSRFAEGVDQDVNTVVVYNTKGKVLDRLDVNTAAQKYGLSAQDIKNQLRTQDNTILSGTKGQFTVGKPMVNKTESTNTQGVAEGFPYDVDHMPGPVIRDADMTSDNVKTRDKAYWDRAVDSINARVFDDMAEFRTDSRGESVTGNSAVWAKWDAATETGWFNRKGRPLKIQSVKEQGVAEGKIERQHGDIKPWAYWGYPERVAKKLYQIHKGQPIDKSAIVQLWKQDGPDRMTKFMLKPDVSAILSAYEQMSNEGPLFKEGEEQGMAEAEKNPFNNPLGKALYRDLSKEKKASPVQVQRNKERWAKRQAEKAQGVAEAERNEMDTPEFQRALASLKKSAAQGPKKTVYDPKTGKYKVVPVKDKKESAYESKLLDKLSALVENLDSAEYNDEAGMAENNLHTLARAVEGLLDTIKSNDNLPEWVQEKIAKAEMILVTVWDYLLSQKEQGIDPEIT